MRALTNLVYTAVVLRFLDRWSAEVRVTPAQRWVLYAVVTAVICVLAALHRLWSLPVITFPVDDAYITLHNAQVLAAGGHDAFGVPGLVGATSGFHVVLVRILLVFFDDPLRALLTAAWLGTWLYALGIARMALDFGCSRATALAWTIALLFVAFTPTQLMNGLETGWALALLTWTLVLSHASSWQRWLYPIVAAQLPFVRPEFVALVPLVVVATAYEHERKPAARLRRIVLDGALICAATLPWLLLYWSTTGVPYPTTVSAKRYFFSEACFSAAIRSERVLGSMVDFYAKVGALVAAVVFLPRHPRGLALLVFLLLDYVAYYVQLPGALGHYGWRYQYIAIPMLAYGALRLDKPWGRIVRKALGYAVLLPSLVLLPAALTDLKNTMRFTNAELVSVSSYLNEHVPANETILLHDVGYVGYADQGHKLVDLVGLKTPSNIAYHRDYTTPSCGRKRGEATHLIALASQARWIVVLDGWDKLFKFIEQLQAFGWKADLVRPDGAYRVYHLTPPANDR